MQNTSHITNHRSRQPARRGRFTLLATLAAAVFTSSAQAERSYLSWAQPFANEANVTQNGVACAMDRRGNVAVTSYVFINNKENYYTIKYDGLTGVPLWGVPFTRGFGHNRPSSIACDSKGNVIVTGRAEGNGTGFDYYTIKYNGATGQIMWQMPYSNSSGSDEAVKVVVDNLDDVIVTGKSFAQGKQEDIYTIKYASLNGAKMWDYRYNSAGNFADVPAALFVDENRDVAVAGSSRVANDLCFYTLKLNSAGAFIFDETFDSGANDYATGVAIDHDGNVVVTGTKVGVGGIYAFHTIKYGPQGGQPLWSRTYTSPDSSFIDPTGVVVDGDNHVIVAGSSRLDNFKVTFFTTKYDGGNGGTLWEKRSPALDGTDTMHGLAIDGSGNPVVGGSSYDTQTGYDFYAIKYDGATGGPLWEQRLDGRRIGGTDQAYGLAVDAVGNIALVGTGQKPNGSAFSEMITAKFNRFLLTKGDPISGPGLTPAAVISTYNVPALANSGALTAKVGVKDGNKSYAAVLAQGDGRGNTAFARQGLGAPDASPALFKSFSDPVIAPDGSVAFAAKLGGVSGAFASGVWTDTFNMNGTLQGVLLLGKQVPGMDSGVLLKSVTGISLQDGCLVALITVKGTNVSKKNATVILGMTSKTTGKALLRTDQALTVNGKTGLIKKLTFFTPPKTSPGHGRYHRIGQVVANATLDDKRIVAVSSDLAGNLTYLGASQGDASNVISGAEWKSFGPPVVGSNGFHYAALATLKIESGVVTAAKDTAIVYSLLGGIFDNIAVESGMAPGSNGGTFSAFTDPVSNDQGRYAFLATAKGGDFAGGKVGLWFGTSGAPNLLTRVGQFAPDGIGNATTAKFTAFKNVALPNGIGASPIFLATIGGTGVSKKNNLGLWGRDSDGFLRQLLRTGDVLGTQTVKSFVLLNSLAGSTSVNRSFNATGGVAALVSFTDRSQAIVYVGFP